ncbi:MAG: hypothetical protein ACK4OF_00820 [Aquificaceae bacterium]
MLQALEELKELREYVKEKVKNAYLRNKHLKEIDTLIKSLESEPKRVSEQMEGTSLDTYYLWRVLTVKLTAHSPERCLRDLSVLKKGLWGDLIRALAPTSGVGA